jgi:hypothetical protein
VSVTVTGRLVIEKGASNRHPIATKALFRGRGKQFCEPGNIAGYLSELAM